MKKTAQLCFLLVLTTLSNAYSQWIQTLDILPENPTTTDSIFLIATVQTPNSTCNLNEAKVIIENSVVGVNACYAHGMLTAICQRTDTIALGKYEQAGEYELLFMASLTGDFNDTTCMSPSGSTMSSFNFMVDLANPVSAINPGAEFEIYPNPSRGTIELLFKNKNPFSGQVQWFDQYGKLVHSLFVETTNQNVPLRVNLSHLSNGLYYCMLIGADNRKATKRMMLIK